MMKQPELGKKVLELRQARGLTQTELAESCRVSLRTIQRIEAAEVTPHNHTVKLIFSCLDYDFNDLSKSRMDGNRAKRPIQRLIDYVRDLFNLKTNAMKKLSVLSLFAIFVFTGVFLVNNTINAQEVDGWFLAGDKPASYKIGLDKTVYKTAPSSALLESVEAKITGFGTLMQTCGATDYLGKRVKMTAWVKAENVADWAGMWLRVDSEETKGYGVSFDNMHNRPIKGTKDWTRCEIVLDVPMNSVTLNFGILLSGTGKVWFDNVAFEVVDNNTPKTGLNMVNKRPVNLDFGK